MKGRAAILPVDGKLKCTRCDEWKPVEAYSPNKVRKCGRASRCKTCQAADSRDYYTRNADRVIARSSKWRAERPDKVAEYREKHAEATRQYMKQNRAERPMVWAARKAVNNAIRAGTFQRLPCEVCGAVRSEAHHHKGYEQEHWFDVRWLCRRHHIEEHKSMDHQEPAPK